MGTLLDITLYAPSEEEGRAILNDTFRVAEDLDSVLSTWKPESPVSTFNRGTTTAPQRVDPHLYQVVSVCQDLMRRTDGAFNIAVRPLVEMWEHAAQSGQAPTTIELVASKRLIAHDVIPLSLPSSLGKKFPGVMIETGGIGKGYAVDEMVKFLRDRGVSQAFINFGRSSMAAIGAPPGAEGWVIELALNEAGSDGMLELRDETLSVSRARGTPFIVNGVAYAHIFDPKTGMPVTTVRGAAVRGLSATNGEAFVKYLIIRGVPLPHIARAWGDVTWIVRNGDSVERSKGFVGIN
jgi:thiamine biosynthesis lipoprotein